MNVNLDRKANHLPGVGEKERNDNASARIGGIMAITCTRCEGTGFLNYDQLDDGMADQLSAAEILDWIKSHPETEVCACDCCGDGEGWYGEPGEHYNREDPPGKSGPYAYNGGLCECN